jgi:hypothetical protein
MSIAVNLKPSNKPPISGYPGVPKTYPQFDSVLEIRQTNSDTLPFINQVTIKFVTIDLLKFSKNNVPNSTTKLNYELTFPFNEKIIGIDLPFSIPIHQNVSPTLETNNFKVNHCLKVEVAMMNKQIKYFDFPVVVNKYDNLPIYRQFNQPISKTIDAKDGLFFVDYSLPCSSIGPFEDLQLKLTLKKSNYEKSSVKLKKIGIDVVEIFDCRCDNSFMKETVISSQVFEINEQINDIFSKMFNINLQKSSSQGTNPYNLFNKQQNPELLKLSDTGITKTNNLKPFIIDHDSENPIPHKSHNNYCTFKTNFFQVYYQLNVKLKYNRSKSVEFQQPFTISNHDRIESMELIKRILNDSKQVNEDDFVYNSKYDLFRRKKTPHMTIMRSKEDKDKFV